MNVYIKGQAAAIRTGVKAIAFRDIAAQYSLNSLTTTADLEKLLVRNSYIYPTLDPSVRLFFIPG
jgi:hypothetical protein